MIVTIQTEYRMDITFDEVDCYISSPMSFDKEKDKLICNNHASEVAAQLMLMGATTVVPHDCYYSNETGPSRVVVLGFNRGKDAYVIRLDSCAFIMNNDGKTIDRIMVSHNNVSVE